MEGKYNEANSSTQELGTENFDWVYNPYFPKKMIFDRKSRQINDEGLYYQASVNKILRTDIFNDFNFHQEKNGAIDFDFKKVYKINYDQLLTKKIKPDFYVYKIENKKFFEILKSRNYMMTLKNKYNIPEKVKFISILGEIKSSYSSCHIDYDQQSNNYEQFIDLANKLENDEYIILMYIYDNSFNLFRKDYDIMPEQESPIIYAYAPKLYYEDCYYHYNELIRLLKLNKKK